jgi:hypothetical protein
MSRIVIVIKRLDAGRKGKVERNSKGSTGG